MSVQHYGLLSGLKRSAPIFKRNGTYHDRPVRQVTHRQKILSYAAQQQQAVYRLANPTFEVQTVSPIKRRLKRVGFYLTRHMVKHRIDKFRLFAVGKKRLCHG